MLAGGGGGVSWEWEVLFELRLGSPAYRSWISDLIIFPHRLLLSATFKRTHNKQTNKTKNKQKKGRNKQRKKKKKKKHRKFSMSLLTATIMRTTVALTKTFDNGVTTIDHFITTFQLLPRYNTPEIPNRKHERGREKKVLPIPIPFTQNDFRSSLLLLIHLSDPLVFNEIGCRRWLAEASWVALSFVTYIPSRASRSSSVAPSAAQDAHLAN